MAGATITLDDSTVNDALKRLYDAAGNIKPALKNIGEGETRTTRQRFKDKTDPDGKPWQKLNDLYKTTKKGSGILVGNTGDLRIINWQMDDDEVTIGSNVVYARIHNEGGKIVPKTASALVFSMGGQTFKVKSVTIPRRQFLGFNEASIENMLEVIRAHFLGDFDGHGGSTKIGP